MKPIIADVPTPKDNSAAGLKENDSLVPVDATLDNLEATLDKALQKPSAVVIIPVVAATTVEPLKDENAQQAERQLLANIERFVTRIRMVAQQIIQQFDNSDDKAEDDQNEELQLVRGDPENAFDPDNDGFIFGVKQANLLHNTMNILQYVRRNLGIIGKENSAK